MNFLTIDIFLIIFIGMGPVKVLLLYIAATKDASPELQRKVARKAVMTATIVGIVLLLAGVVFMRLLHFSRGALTIAGGIILLLLALGIVLSPAKKEDHETAPDEGTLMSMAVYPLGIPMLLNPIGIVALTAHEGVQRLPVGLAQSGQRLPGPRRIVARRRPHETPARRLELVPTLGVHRGASGAPLTPGLSLVSASASRELRLA